MYTLEHFYLDGNTNIFGVYQINSNLVQSMQRSYPELFEQRDVLGCGVSANGLNARVDAPQARVCHGLLVRRVIAVAIKYHLFTEPSRRFT